MKTRFVSGRVAGVASARRAMIALWIGVAIVSLVPAAAGQGGLGPGPGGGPVPRAVPAATWPPARLPDGQPDIQGTWYIPGGGTGRIYNPTGFGGLAQPGEYPTKEGAKPGPTVSRIVDPPDGHIPYQPWAEARRKQQEASFFRPAKPEEYDTQARCLVSVPRLMYYVSDYKIIQPPGYVVFLWEYYHQHRIIYLDGRPHIGPNIKLWKGDARGRWEGNTLVVDTTNHNGKIRLSSVGDFFTGKVHLTERFAFVDANTINYEVTIDDPAVYTRPWTMRIVQKRRAPEMWVEESCHEGYGVRPSNPTGTVVGKDGL